MGSNGSWDIIRHSMNEKRLKKILIEQYGLHDIEVAQETGIDDLIAHTLDCCSEIGVVDYSRDQNARQRGELRGQGATDESFFDRERCGAKFSQEIANYLVLDALFHIRWKQENSGPSHESFAALFNSIPDSGRMDESGKSKLLKQNVIGSGWRDVLGITQEVEKGNYEIPRFLDRVTFGLISSIVKNPYSKNKCGKVSFGSLKHFFEKTVRSIENRYEEDVFPAAGNQLLARYLMERLYDVNTMVYVAEKLSQETPPTTVEDPIALNPYEITKRFASILFIPNPFSKRAYCDRMLRILRSTKEETTTFDRWVNPEGTIAAASPHLSGPEIAAKNLIHCEEYIKFLATVYYPLVTACFYMMLCEAYPEEKREKVLTEYIERQDLLKICQGRSKQWQDELLRLDKKGKDLLAKLYAQIQNEVCDSKTLENWRMATELDYVSTQRYQEQMLDAVMKEKILYKRKKKPVFIW